MLFKTREGEVVVAERARGVLHYSLIYMAYISSWYTGELGQKAQKNSVQKKQVAIRKKFMVLRWDYVRL